MNRKQLNILIGLVFIVGGLGLFLYSKKVSSWKATDSVAGGKLLPDFPINEVAQIVITKGTTNLTLAKKDDLWRVQERWDYPANFSDIGELLRKLWEIETVQSVPVGPSQLGRLELLSPDQGDKSGTRLEVIDKEGKTLKSLLLGKDYVRDTDDSSPMGGGGYPVGKYLMVEGSDSGETPGVWLVSETFSQVEPKPDRWLNKDFFKIEKLRSVSVTSTNATNSWKIFRETEGGDLNLADVREGEAFDKSKASSVGYLLSSPSFNDIVSPDKTPAASGLDEPLVATIETFDNFTYTIKVGGKTDDDNYHLKVAVSADIRKDRAQVEEEKEEDKERLDKEFNENREKLEEKLTKEKALQDWTYLVSKWTIDTLLKPRTDFMAEKKEEETTDSNGSAAAATAPPTIPEVGIPPPLPTPPVADEDTADPVEPEKAEPDK